MVGVAIAGGKAVQVALHDCALAGRKPSTLPVKSLVYARGGYFLGAIPAPLHRQPVTYNRLSSWIRAATVAAEDRTFWKNDGLDYTSIARAALADLSAGRTVQGASTSPRGAPCREPRPSRSSSCATSSSTTTTRSRGNASRPALH